ncbi:hypothetical protein HDU77_010725, partial [Chytriomyces hyalinus]
MLCIHFIGTFSELEEHNDGRWCASLIGDIVVIAVYLAPRLGAQDLLDFDNFITSITQLYPDAPTILMGDFNARDIVVIAVYLAPRLGAQDLLDFDNFITSITQLYPDAPTILMGDFNALK